MKKKILLISILCLCCVPVYALTSNFKIDSSKFSFSSSSKKNDVMNEFNKNYDLTYNISSSDDKLKDEITTLSKKVTYLLLGEGDSLNESAEEYYERIHDYLEMRYAPEIPKNPNSLTGLDENSQEYKDDIVSGIAVPGVFNLFDELNVIYDSIESIRVSINDDMIISMVSLPNIKIREENKDDPMNYQTKKTNLILYYYFKKLNDKYKLYYLFGETTEDLNEYFVDIEDSEMTKAFSISENYDSQLSNIYDYSKLKSLDDNKLNEIYNNNSKNIVIMNAYYNTDLVASANGFFISDGLVVTTWSFLEKALINSQFFVIKNNNGNFYEVDGIVTANPESDIAVIKLKQNISSNTKLGNIDNLNIEDPVIAISSKSGVGLTLHTGIITSKDGYIQSALPLVETDEGSPLYNSNGEVIGINTSKSTNSSISMSVNSKALEEIKNKLSNISFDNIETIAFDDLKEKYYYINYESEKIINSIPSSKWKKYKKIGNIENTIKLELVKANYDENVVSLRYYNSISKYISSMQLASLFKEKLQSDGYTQILDSSTKCIYTNKDFKIIIMTEFDYLIIVIVEL